MRIVGGKWRGRTINPPKNLRARPTTDFAKENLFNILQNLVDFEECTILDLFAGTGSISYEFASRGAKQITTVEINRVHHAFIRKCAAEFEMENLVAVNANAVLYAKSCKKRFDIIFADPPYDQKESLEVIDIIFERGLLEDEAILIFEHSKSVNFEEHPNFWQMRSYGSVNFTFFTKKEE